MANGPGNDLDTQLAELESKWKTRTGLMKMRGKGFLVWSPPAAAAKKEIIKIRYISAAAEEITTRTNYKSYKREFPFLKIKKLFYRLFFSLLKLEPSQLLR